MRKYFNLVTADPIQGSWSKGPILLPPANCAVNVRLRSLRHACVHDLFSRVGGQASRAPLRRKPFPRDRPRRLKGAVQPLPQLTEESRPRCIWPEQSPTLPLPGSHPRPALANDHSTRYLHRQKDPPIAEANVHGGKRGVATLCVGGGNGVALAVSLAVDRHTPHAPSFFVLSSSFLVFVLAMPPARDTQPIAWMRNRALRA